MNVAMSHIIFFLILPFFGCLDTRYWTFLNQHKILDFSKINNMTCFKKKKFTSRRTTKDDLRYKKCFKL
jgi:hypothetical protein